MFAVQIAATVVKDGDGGAFPSLRRCRCIHGRLVSPLGENYKTLTIEIGQISAVNCLFLMDLNLTRYNFQPSSLLGLLHNILKAASHGDDER